MSERIRGSYDDALYKSTFTLLNFTTSTILIFNKQISFSGKVLTTLQLDSNEDCLLLYNANKNYLY